MFLGLNFVVRLAFYYPNITNNYEKKKNYKQVENKPAVLSDEQKNNKNPDRKKE